MNFYLIDTREMWYDTVVPFFPQGPPGPLGDIGNKVQVIIRFFSVAESP